MRQVENLIHSEPTIVTNRLENSERHLWKVTTSHYANDTKTNCITAHALNDFTGFVTARSV